MRSGRATINGGSGSKQVSVSRDSFQIQFLEAMYERFGLSALGPRTLLQKRKAKRKLVRVGRCDRTRLAMSLRAKIAGHQWWVQERAVSRRIEDVLASAEVDTCGFLHCCVWTPKLSSDEGPNAEERLSCRTEFDAPELLVLITRA